MKLNQENLSMKKTDPQTLEFALNRLLALTPLGEGLRRIRVLQAWEQIKPFAGGSVDYSSGILYVRTVSSMEREVMLHRKADLIGQVNSIVEEYSVKDIVFR